MNIVKSGQKYTVGHFLEKINGNITSTNLLKIRHFFHDSIVYPFVNFRINKSSFEISSKEH